MLSTIFSLWFFYIHGPVFIHSVSTPRYDELLRGSTPNMVLDFSHIVLGCCSYINDASHVHVFCDRYCSGSPLSSQYGAVALQEASGLDLPRLAVTSRLRRFGRYEEREEVVYDVSRGNACDVSVIVCGCDFDDVCATG